MIAMKRFLLAFLLVTVCLAVLAAPAFADLRPSVDTAYVVPMKGVWLEVKGDVNVPVKYGHPLSYPIPANYDVVIDVPWRGINYGLVTTVPLALKYTLQIPAAGSPGEGSILKMTEDRAMRYWSGAVLWDEYWSALLATGIPAFNPNIGAKPYANHWWGAVTGPTSFTTGLTPDGKLAPGVYTATLTLRVLRTITDLTLTSVGQTTPTKMAPGTAPPVPFTFVVGPPAT
jgi:hypothetical protein